VAEHYPTSMSSLPQLPPSCVCSGALCTTMLCATGSSLTAARHWRSSMTQTRQSSPRSGPRWLQVGGQRATNTDGSFGHAGQIRCGRGGHFRPTAPQRCMHDRSGRFLSWSRAASAVGRAPVRRYTLVLCLVAATE